MMKELSANDVNVTDSVDVNIDDESVLTEGMILDSRIVKLIDELEITNDDFNDDGNLNENILEFLGLR